ncbi:hypothetical protein [Pseudoalteromonas sp. MMG005]|uniref:hypothetical protein n=1 Tax=Pseudoalteromonas sp. MMG005 TaxID=2822682 RepID=UPI001B3A3EE4|nr:hypothetical protein [Pseudoalteromonas sp. MMG005]MBQ4846582.1 hypothetical protein [Pseudoalteromonas sp. MMG005]
MSIQCFNMDIEANTPSINGLNSTINTASTVLMCRLDAHISCTERQPQRDLFINTHNTRYNGVYNAPHNKLYTLCLQTSLSAFAMLRFLAGSSDALKASPQSASLYSSVEV